LTGIVHTIVGACVGSFFKNRAGAFAAGLASHVVLDAIPHKDFGPALEIPLAAGALAGIAGWRGVISPEFVGAMGGLCPDIEHGLGMVGILTEEQRAFPTHIFDGKYHAPESDERLSQLLIAAAALAVIALNTRRE